MQFWRRGGSYREQSAIVIGRTVVGVAACDCDDASLQNNSAIDAVPTTQSEVDDQFVQRWRLQQDASESEAHAAFDAGSLPDVSTTYCKLAVLSVEQMLVDDTDELPSPPWAVGLNSWSSLQKRTCSVPAVEKTSPRQVHDERNPDGVESVPLANCQTQSLIQPTQLVLATATCEALSEYLDTEWQKDNFEGANAAMDESPAAERFQDNMFAEKTSFKAMGNMAGLSMARAIAGGA